MDKLKCPNCGSRNTSHWRGADYFCDDCDEGFMSIESIEAAPPPCALDLPNEPLCVCGKPLSKHQGVVCLPESASQ